MGLIDPGVDAPNTSNCSEQDAMHVSLCLTGKRHNFSETYTVLSERFIIFVPAVTSGQVDGDVTIEKKVSQNTQGQVEFALTLCARRESLRYTQSTLQTFKKMSETCP